MEQSTQLVQSESSSIRAAEPWDRSEAVTYKRPGDDLYSSNLCVTGRVATKTQRAGAGALGNQLTVDARSYTREYTLLQREVNLIIRILLALIVFFVAVVIISAILNERPILESVRVTSILFGLAPSSLFLMIVVAYTIGRRDADRQQRLARAACQFNRTAM